MVFYSAQKHIRLLIFYFIFTTICYTLSAQKDTARKHFYAGIETGISCLSLSHNSIDEKRSARYALGFYGGYSPAKALKLGVNLNGYIIEPYGNFSKNPEKGISISNIQGQVQIIPFKQTTVFINLLGGWSSYINHHPDGYNSGGIAGKAGIGYEHGFAKRLIFSIIINYSVGKFNAVKYPGISINNQHYHAFELLTCFHFM